METDRAHIECVRVYTDTLNNDPFILQFYRGTPAEDKELVVKEALENILLNHQNDNYMAWNITDGSILNIESKKLAKYDIILIARTFQPPLDNLKFVDKMDESMNGHVSLKNKRNQASSGLVEPDKFSQSLGPKAEIAIKDSRFKLSHSASRIKFSLLKENFQKEISDSPNKKDVTFQNLPFSEIILNGDNENRLKQEVLTQPIDNHSSHSHVINLEDSFMIQKSNSSKENDQSINGISLNVKEYGKIYTNLENKIANQPIDGDNHLIYTTTTNFPIFTYLHKIPEQKYNPKFPPPTYIQYSTLSKLEPSDKAYIFKGVEITSGGEIKCVDKEILEKQKGIVMEVLSKLAKSIAEGRGVVGISLPVRIFEARSMLERITDWWSFLPTFLLPAAYQKTPIERMKNIVAFAVGGLYTSASQLKPFNPLLGETYQGFFPGYDIDISCEHISHHPPIANFLITHKDFRFYGRYEFQANLETNTLTLLQDGPNYCEFKDGGKIVFYWPFIKVHGMLFGERTVKWVGVIKVIDEKNRMKAIIKMDDGGKKSVFSKVRTDIFNGAIYNYKEIINTNSKKKTKREQHKEDAEMKDVDQILAQITGSWLEYLEIDGKQFWCIDKHFPTRAQPVENPIPSDCRYREDLIWVKYGNLHFAEEWKVKLEERQRHERKLKQDYNYKKKKKN